VAVPPGRRVAAARADLAEARQVCHYAAPLLAEPFWQFTEIVCHWLGGTGRPRTQRGPARARGRTNQQIARALDISVKTVEAYLTRLYRKTACSSRVELAVAVTERRLHLGGNG
jgi:Bacterial regulatory proteins, luxR family